MNKADYCTRRANQNSSFFKFRIITRKNKKYKIKEQAFSLLFLVEVTAFEHHNRAFKIAILCHLLDFMVGGGEQRGEQ